MKLVLAAIIATCSAPPPKRPPPGATPAATAMATGSPAVPATAMSLEDTAVSFARAATTGDTAAARALTMTHEQFVALSNNAPDKAELDEEVNDFLSDIAREFSDAKAKVVGAKVAQTRTLDPSTDSKVKYRVEVALVQLVIEENGETAPRGVPLVFIKTDAGWRFSPKK